MIDGFNPLEHQLVLNYDASFGQAPTVFIAPDPHNVDDGVVFADGLAVAIIRGGARITREMVRVVPVGTPVLEPSLQR